MLAYSQSVAAEMTTCTCMSHNVLGPNSFNHKATNTEGEGGREMWGGGLS